MNTIILETGKGLQATLIEILKPIKVKKTDGTTQYRSTFEFIGVVDNPIEAIKKYGKGVFENLNIIKVE